MQTNWLLLVFCVFSGSDVSLFTPHVISERFKGPFNERVTGADSVI